jgi:hypothetical protein
MFIRLAHNDFLASLTFLIFLSLETQISQVAHVTIHVEKGRSPSTTKNLMPVFFWLTKLPYVLKDIFSS